MLRRSGLALLIVTCVASAVGVACVSRVDVPGGTPTTPTGTQTPGTLVWLSWNAALATAAAAATPLSCLVESSGGSALPVEFYEASSRTLTDIASATEFNTWTAADFTGGDIDNLVSGYFSIASGYPIAGKSSVARSGTAAPGPSSALDLYVHPGAKNVVAKMSVTSGGTYVMSGVAGFLIGGGTPDDVTVTIWARPAAMGTPVQLGTLSNISNTAWISGTADLPLGAITSGGAIFVSVTPGASSNNEGLRLAFTLTRSP